MMIRFWDRSRRTSTSFPVAGSYAPIWPSPKLPMRMSPPNAPKIVGATAIPHGEFNFSLDVNRLTIVPSGLKTSTKPFPMPSL
jgi:hypothetical protein